MMTETDSILRNTQAATILQRCVVLTLGCHYLGNDRKIDLERVVNAAAPDREAPDAGLAIDDEQVRATKKLIDPTRLRPVMRVLSQAKAYLRSVAISGHRVFGERSYLVPLALVEEADATLVRLAGEVFLEAGKLADAYASLIDEQAIKLGPLFDRDDYKSPADVRRAFAIEWDYVSFQAPERLETVDHALYERTRTRYEARMAAAYDEFVIGLREDALGILTDLESRLTPTLDGTRKRIMPTALRDLQDYIARLPQRNVTGDTALPDALARVAKLADGLTVEQLKSSASVRDALRTAAGEAKAALARLVETAPRRAIAFGDGSSA